MKRCDVKTNSDFYKSIISDRKISNSNKYEESHTTDIESIHNSSEQDNNLYMPNSLGIEIQIETVSSFSQLQINPFNTFPFKIEKIKKTKKLKENPNKKNIAWIHMSCALFIPEVEIADFYLKQEIKKIEQIDKKRFKEKCDICQLKGYGPTVRCGYLDCEKKFHAECARVNHYSLEINNNKGIFECLIFCHIHSKDKLLKTLNMSKIKQIQDIIEYGNLINKCHNNFEKEYGYSLVKLEKNRKLNKDYFKNCERRNLRERIVELNKKNNFKHNNKDNNVKITRKALSLFFHKNDHTISNKEVDYKNAFDRLKSLDKNKFYHELKKACKLICCKKIVIKKIKNNEENEKYTYQIDSESDRINFRNSLRYLDVVKLFNKNQFPYSVINFKKYNPLKIRALFNYLIPDEATFNRKIIKRSRPHKCKLIKNRKTESQIQIEENNMLNITCESGVENVENLNINNQLYCYCQKPYVGNQIMIGCDIGEDKCKGNKWFHKTCVPFLKKMTWAQIRSDDFKFICKECLDSHIYN